MNYSVQEPRPLKAEVADYSHYLFESVSDKNRYKQARRYHSNEQVSDSNHMINNFSTTHLFREALLTTFSFSF